MNDETENEETAEEKQERLRQALLICVADARLTTVQTKVAWILNHLPDTRNSDVTLQLRYWEQFCGDRYQGGPIDPQLLFTLPRLTSLSRARATIQNTLGLYLADEDVRRHRGTLEDEVQDQQVHARNVPGSFSVYIDESGKTGDFLIVGSCWLLNGIESLNITRQLDSWRNEVNFHHELHFVDISRGNIDRYMEALDILSEHAAALCFKSIAVERRGIRDIDSALEDMMHHLLVRGVAHERDSGRATLPRTIQIWKDAENPARDQLLVANLQERLSNASRTEFDNDLVVGNIFANDSQSNPFLQFADLFVSSTNRRIQNPIDNPEHPKDIFATTFLDRFGVNRDISRDDTHGDMVVFEDV